MKERTQIIVTLEFDTNHYLYQKFKTKYKKEYIKALKHRYREGALGIGVFGGKLISVKEKKEANNEIK